MFRPTSSEVQPLRTEGGAVFKQEETDVSELIDEPHDPNWRPHTAEEYEAEGRITISVARNMNIGYPTSSIVLGIGGTKSFDDAEVKEVGSCVYAETAKGDVKLANFIVRVQSIDHRHSLSGTTDYLKLLLQKDRRKISYEIKKAGYCSLAKALRQDHAEFMIFPKIDRHMSRFETYLACVYGEAVEGGLPETHSYDYAGWQVLPSGEWHFFSNLDKECLSTRSLLPIGSIRTEIPSAVNWLFHLTELGDPKVMWPIFLYKFTGVLAKPFVDVLKPINFILDICGKTNTGKTSVARPMYGDFDPDLEMVNFTGTASGIDRFVESKYDGVAVVDDLSNTLDKQSQQTLERLLRQFCDTNGRVTAAAAGGINRTTMRGGIVVTSEDVLEGNRQSSTLRLLVVPVARESFQKALLDTLQVDALQRKRNGHYSQMDIAMTAFIDFVSHNYDEIGSQILTDAIDSADVQFPRLQNTYELLQHIGSIVYDFGVRYGALQLPKGQYMSNIRSILKPLIRYNSALGTQADPSTLFLSMIVPAIKQNLLPIAQGKEVFAQNMSCFMGFFELESDGRKLKVDHERIYGWVLQHCRSIGLPFQASLSELLKKLLDAGYSEGYQQKDHAGKPLKQLTIAGKKLKLLVLRWDSIVKVTEKL